MTPGETRLLQICHNGLDVCPEIYYQQTFKSDFHMQVHRHILLEMMYAVSSCFFVSFPQKDGSLHTVKVKQGSYIIINSAVYHRLDTQNNQPRIFNVEFLVSDNHPFYINFSSIYEKASIFREFVDPDWDYVVIQDNNQILPLMRRIHQLMVSNATSDQADVENLMIRLLTCQLFLESAQIHVLNTNSQGSNYIQTAIGYIHEHLDENFRVADIASYININPTYLEKVFRQRTGTTLVHYINKLRINRAVTYLTESDLSIIDIGLAVGFNNRQHFSRVFTQITGVSPGTYRRTANTSVHKNYVDLDQYVLDKL